MKFIRLKEIRKESNITQKEVANVLNVERSTYTGWENGKNTIPLKQLIKICNYYKCSIDYMTGLTNKNKYYCLIELDINVIGKNLKTLRIKNKLKQKDIYSFLKISSSSYSSYETNKILIPTEIIYKIAKKFNCSIDCIITKK